MDLTANGVRYHVEIVNETKKPTLVFLHGFTGSSKTWLPVIARLQEFKIVLVDLIGHGQTDSPEQVEKYAMAQQLNDLEELFAQLELEQFMLVGYSMGGRTALAYACTYPERVEALVLESASPGLRTQEEQKQRRTNDAMLAERLLKDGVPAFVDFWENIELFDSQKHLPDSVKRAVREERLAQHPVGLANSLLGMGTGSQESYWGQLEDMRMPVLLVAGALDPKFMGIAKAMQERIRDAQFKVVQAGHAIHVEKPLEFATIVEEYLLLKF
ncbi:2-succinyl-6-hydroxy-2,4-cyclohexadiene-1-carboxylate synthase [Planococcus sp. YIM B11945]|uniref:2-succinyl-6-hydroxy-2, 4-cyclohexadiene-1-carboxylate synthase n=1 Tax=Planococcus sp. YIM B11945 TaxID=3435410 RepID=UPI003D7E7221